MWLNQVFATARAMFTCESSFNGMFNDHRRNADFTIIEFCFAIIITNTVATTTTATSEVAMLLTNWKSTSTFNEFNFDSESNELYVHFRIRLFDRFK